MRRVLFSFVMIWFVIGASAQKTSLFSGEFNDEPFLKLIELVETNSSYRFYFQIDWIDTVRVNGKFEQADIHSLLSNAFKNTLLRYYILDHKIILLKNDYIIDQIDSSFFDKGNAKNDLKPNYYFQKESTSNQSIGLDSHGIVEIGTKQLYSSNRDYELTGTVRDASGRKMNNALLLLEGSTRGIATDSSGHYRLVIKPGIYSVVVQYTGMKRTKQKMLFHSSGSFDFVLEEDLTTLKEVMIEASSNASLPVSQIGTAKIDMQTMKNIPKVLGENDLLKVALTMPGIKTIGEGSAGIYVRGGNADQNLILLNEATIYNPMHLFGFFSIFNASSIKSSEVYKSSIPVQFGGRLSSVFDLQMRDGSQKKLEGSGGIGPVTSSLTLEGPLSKKISFLAGGRITYSDWVLNMLPNSSIKNSKASFNDFFFKFSYKPNKSNSYHFSMYSSNDKFKISYDSLFSYHNLVAILQWKHSFHDNLQGTMTFSQSFYDYNLNYAKVPQNSFNLGLGMNENNFKYDLSFFHGRHKLDFGVQSKLYNLNPGFIHKASDESLITPMNVESEKGLENALYFADNFELSPRVSLYAGLRFSHFSSLGPRTLYKYNPLMPKSSDSVTDTIRYNNNSAIGTYYGPEFRVSFLYKLGNNMALKASYGRTRQYLQMLSNTVSVTPINTWKLSQPGVLPQIGDQVSIGVFKDIPGKSIELSVEGYYKWIQNIIDYKTGATLVLNSNVERDILQGEAKAYGVEFLIKKKSGRLNGWVGYTYSRTFIKLDSGFPQEKINNGQYYPASYDKPHDVNVVANYRITRRYSFSLNFVYSTGRPITFPQECIILMAPIA